MTAPIHVSTRTSKRRITLLAMCSFFGLAATALVLAQPDDPRPSDNVLMKHADTLVFYTGFNGDALAELTPDNPEPDATDQLTDDQRWVDGFFGKGMRTDQLQLRYELPDSGPLAMTGAAAFWLRVSDQKHASEPVYISFFKLQSGPRMISARRMGKAVNKRQLFGYLKDGKVGVSAVRGSMASWTPDTWHLLVVNWGPNWVEFSLDGRTLHRKTLAAGERNHGDHATLRIGSPYPNDPFVIDEFMLFSSPLSNDDIQWLWKLQNEPTGKQSSERVSE